MSRDFRFDVARVVCMSFIISFVHLYAYIYTKCISACVIPSCAILCDSCLGLFTFVSGYLLGSKYSFGEQGGIWSFYKKRILRIIPLFVLSAVVLWLIGFNGTRQTLNGLLCISPFVTPRPRTLWYIPVILLCYAVTPIISRNTLKSRIRNCFIVYALFLGIGRLIPSTDSRLLINLFFYMGGVISSSCFDWKMNFRYGKHLKLLIIMVFILLVCIGQMNDDFHLKLYRRIVGGIGVFPLLFLCQYISNMFFDSVNVIKNRWKGWICQLIGFISYASMACYMFHRLFFYVGEKIYNPDTPCVKWLYMAGIVFPIMLYMSFYIQKFYDLFVTNSKNQNRLTIERCWKR